MKRFLGVLIIIIMLLCCGCGTEEKGDKGKKKESKNIDEIVELKDTVNKATYEDFISITIGEKYDKVVKVLGEANRLKKCEEGKIYFWDIEGNKSISLEFNNKNEVVKKSQGDFENNKKGISIDLYSQLNEGMKREDVEKIIGSGNLSIEEKDGNLIKSIYSYKNEDGSSAILTYHNDVLYSKSKNRLD